MATQYDIRLIPYGERSGTLFQKSFNKKINSVSKSIFYNLLKLINAV